MTRARAAIALSPPAPGPPSSWAGFHDAADFGQAVWRVAQPGRGIDPRLVALTHASAAAGDADGAGYLVPPALSARVFDLMFEPHDLLALMDPETTTRGAVQVEAHTDLPWAGAGIVATWRAERQQLTATRRTTETELVRLHELAAFVEASDALVEDAPRFEQRLTVGAAAALRWRAGEAMLHGTGAGQPLGLLNGGSVVTVAKETSQAAATIVTANVTKMFARLLHGPRAFWLATPDAVPQLAALTIGVQPAYTLPTQSDPGGRLLGYPVLLSAQHASPLGTRGDLVLVNPEGYYAAVRRGQPALASSMHLLFDYAMQAFRWTFRLGGQPHLRTPVTGARDSIDRSHFVALETRG